MKNQHFVCYVTGGLRSGKGLFAVRTIEQFLLQKRRVVTNYDLRLENLLHHDSKNVDVIRVPDRPNIDDLEYIGQGYDCDDPLHYDESKFGLIVLDELGAWFNARSWNEKGRKEVIDWLLHSGKRRWCLLLTIQSLEMLDKQAKEATAGQLVANCKRLGDLPIPVLTPLIKLFTGYHLTLPDMRFATIRAGTEKNAIVNDRVFYKGERYYHAYNTRQEFYPRDHIDCPGIYSYLSPWYLKGRYKKKITFTMFKNWCSENAYLFFAFSLASTLFMFATFIASLFTFNQSNNAVQLLSEIKEKPLITPEHSINEQQLTEATNINCDSFNQVFAKYYLTGHVRFPSGQFIVVSGDSKPVYIDKYIVSDATDTQYNLNTLLPNDAYYEPVNACLAVLNYQNCIYKLTCSKSSINDSVNGDAVAIDGIVQSDDKNIDKTSGFISNLIN